MIKWEIFVWLKIKQNCLVILEFETFIYYYITINEQWFDKEQQNVGITSESHARKFTKKTKSKHKKWYLILAF